MKTSRRVLISLPNKESQAIIISRERNLRTLGEVEGVAWYGVHLVARLVTNVEAALYDDLHLVVRVFVHQRRSFLEAVETGTDWFLGVVMLPAML